MEAEVVVLLSSDDEAGANEPARGAGTAAAAPARRAPDKREGGKAGELGLLAHFTAAPRAPRSTCSFPVCSREFASEREVRLHIDWCLQHGQVRARCFVPCAAARQGREMMAAWSCT